MKTIVGTSIVWFFTFVVEAGYAERDPARDRAHSSLFYKTFPEVNGFCMWYRLNEADILVPERWKDHSVNTFLLPAGPQGGALSFVVTRDHDSPTLDVTRYADQQLILAAKKLPAYQSISRQMITLSDHPAVQADYTWRTPEGATVYQRQAVVKVNATFLVFTFTSLPHDLQRMEELWQPTIQAIRLRP